MSYECIAFRMRCVNVNNSNWWDGGMAIYQCICTLKSTLSLGMPLCAHCVVYTDLA